MALERLSTLETSVVTNENTLKADRTKLRDELQKVKVKTRLIEGEKQQLMIEVGEVNEKLVGAQRDVTNLRVDLGIPISPPPTPSLILTLTPTPTPISPPSPLPNPHPT